MPIELEKRTAQLVNLSANVELHGEDPQPVAYLKLAFGLTIDDLVLFSPTLRGAMFDNAVPPQRRVRELSGPFDCEGKIVGATLTIHRGIDAKSDIKLPGCTVDDFKLDPSDGGQVTFTCKVATHPDKRQIGDLFFMQKESIDVSIQPAQSELQLSAPAAPNKPKKGAKEAPTEGAAELH